jgi:hypothetical protein
MKFTAFQKNLGRTVIYAFEIEKSEIESVQWTSPDEAFFKACSKGSVSKQILGISILAKKIEEASERPLSSKDWLKKIISSDPDESERSEEHTSQAEDSQPPIA